MSARVKTIVYQIGLELETTDCAACGVLFAVDTEFLTRRRKDGKSFYCPNGHSLSYGKSEADKLREELKQKTAAYERATARAIFERDQRKATERSLIATKGHVTRLRKHVQAGLCPYGCRRHFDDLERHIASKHRGESLPAEEAP
jgi:hypothetical protein